MNTVDVLIHITPMLNDEEKQSVTSTLEALPGVSTACFQKPHLMLARYDHRTHEAMELLRVVQQHGLTAQLVGL